MPNAYLVFLILLLGLALGSFLNVVIYRLPKGMSLARPRSHCPFCKKPVRFYDNLPLLGYLLLKGRCRDCKQPISGRYPLVELLTALLFVGLYFKYGFSISTMIYGILFAFLIPISFIDINTGLILDKLTIPGFILGISLVPIFQFENWKSIFLGAFVISILFWLFGLLVKFILKKESLGFGDVKLLVMTGVYVGFPGIGIALFLGAVLALIYVFFGMLLKKVQISDRIPFGPFIALGVVSYIFLGRGLMNWYLGLY